MSIKGYLLFILDTQGGTFFGVNHFLCYQVRIIHSVLCAKNVPLLKLLITCLIILHIRHQHTHLHAHKPLIITDGWIPGDGVRMKDCLGIEMGP